MRLRIEGSHMKPQSITTNSRFKILQHETRLSVHIPSITLPLDVHPLFAHLIPNLRAFRLACKPWWPQTKSGSSRYWKYLLKVKVYQSLGVQTFNHICRDAALRSLEIQTIVFLLKQILWFLRVNKKPSHEKALRFLVNEGFSCPSGLDEGCRERSAALEHPWFLLGGVDEPAQHIWQNARIFSKSRLALESQQCHSNDG